MSTTVSAASTGSSIISALGSGSGVDTHALTESLVNLSQQVQSQKLTSQKTTLETQISDYGLLRSSLSKFQASAAALGSADTFNAKAVSIPNTTQLSITALNSKAVAGDYSLQVQQVAQAQSLASTASYASLNDSIGKGTLTIRLGAWGGGEAGLDQFTVNSSKTGGTIVIDETNNTLSGLRDAINAAKLGVTASIVNDGNGFRLMLNAASGEKNEIEISVSEDAGAPGLAAFNFNETSKSLTQQQEGRDAKISINGLLVSRDTNHITDVIDGLEFDVFSANLNEAVSISISADKSLAEQTVRDFVEAYNTLIAEVDKLIGFDKELDANGSLKSDPLAKNLLQVLRNTLASPVSGSTDLHGTLGAIGIRTKTDGTLQIIEEEGNTSFRAVFDNNYDAVKNLFIPRASSNNASVEVSKYSALTKPGVYEVEITQQPSKGSLTVGNITLPLDTGAKDYSFSFVVDGVTTSDITLPAGKEYVTGADFAADIQSLINMDTNIKSGQLSVTVGFENGALTFTSDAYGSSSNVGFATVSQELADDLGLTAGVGTAGTDIAGTFNGVAGFGFGNVLLGNYGSDSDGLSLVVQPGATSATVNFSRGLAGGVNNLVGSYLSNNGLISDRETTLSDNIKKVDDQSEALQRRTDAYRARLQAQFSAMESIVRSLNNTGGLLDDINDRLPFTSKN